MAPLKLVRPPTEQIRQRLTLQWRLRVERKVHQFDCDVVFLFQPLDPVIAKIAPGTDIVGEDL